MLDKVARLRPVHFTWRTDEFPERHLGTGVNSGLIAQEVENVFPELVGTDDKGFKLVKYSELPFLTLAAIGELNDSLAAQMKAKDDQIRTLTEQVQALAEAVARLKEQKH